MTNTVPRNRDPVVVVLVWGLCAFMVVWTFMTVVYRPDPHFPTHICPVNGDDCYEVFH